MSGSANTPAPDTPVEINPQPLSRLEKLLFPHLFNEFLSEYPTNSDGFNRAFPESTLEEDRATKAMRLVNQPVQTETQQCTVNLHPDALEKKFQKAQLAKELSSQMIVRRVLEQQVDMLWRLFNQAHKDKAHLL